MTTQNYFKTVEHFHVLESRYHNPLKGANGLPTVHPFATVAVGYDPTDPVHPIRIAVAVTHPKDNFIRKVGKQKTIGLLHSATTHHTKQFGLPYPTTKHTKWFTLDEAGKGFEYVIESLGLGHRFAQPERFVVTPVAEKTFKNVIMDVQGLRFSEAKA
jgi:hypothetical protein